MPPAVDDTACARPVLDAHPTEAKAVFDCEVEAERGIAHCAESCPDGKTLDHCVAALPRSESGCIEPLLTVITAEEADQLKACREVDADAGDN